MQRGSSARASSSATTASSSRSKTVTESVEVEEYESQVEAARLTLKPIARERLVVSGGRSARAVVGGGVSGGFASASFASSTSFVAGGGIGFAGGRLSGGDSKLAIDLEAVVEKRQQQKADLVLLNERLADYVEKSRFLEAQNRRLVMESETVKVGFSTEAVNLKARYLLEIEEVKRLIETSEVRRTELKTKVKTVEDHHNTVLNTLSTMETNSKKHLTSKEQLYIQLGEMEGELSTLRRRVGDFDLERKRYTHIIAHLRDEEAEIRRDLEHEKMVTVVARSTVQQIRDELDFLAETHKSKMTEMQALAYRDTTAENRAIWRSEFTEAFRALHEDYMTRLDDVHMEAETSFATTIQQQQTVSSKDTFEISHFAMETQRTTEQVAIINTRITELSTKISHYEHQLTQMTNEKTRIVDEWTSNKTRLGKELDTYKTELANTKQEVQTILDDKLSLEMEIASYKQLLDSEEGRISDRMDKALLEQGRYNARLAQRSMLEAQISGGGGGGGGGMGVGVGGGGFAVGGGGFAVGGGGGGAFFGGSMSAYGSSGYSSGAAGGYSASYSRTAQSASYSSGSSAAARRI